MADDSQPPSPCDISYSQFSAETKSHGNEVARPEHCHCCKRYCFKGYFWAVVGGIVFFVIFPAGILLIIHGHFKGIALTLCLGILVLVICICVLPGAYIGLHHWRRQRARRKRIQRVALNAIKEQAAFVNEVSYVNPNDSVPVIGT